MCLENILRTNEEFAISWSKVGGQQGIGLTAIFSYYNPLIRGNGQIQELLQSFLQDAIYRTTVSK